MVRPRPHLFASPSGHHARTALAAQRAGDAVRPPSFSSSLRRCNAPPPAPRARADLFFVPEPEPSDFNQLWALRRGCRPNAGGGETEQPERCRNAQVIEIKGCSGRSGCSGRARVPRVGYAHAHVCKSIIFIGTAGTGDNVYRDQPFKCSVCRSGSVPAVPFVHLAQVALDGADHRSNKIGVGYGTVAARAADLHLIAGARRENFSPIARDLGVGQGPELDRSTGCGNGGFPPFSEGRSAGDGTAAMERAEISLCDQRLSRPDRKLARLHHGHREGSPAARGGRRARAASPLRPSPGRPMLAHATFRVSFGPHLHVSSRAEGLEGPWLAMGHGVLSSRLACAWRRQGGAQQQQGRARDQARGRFAPEGGKATTLERGLRRVNG